jgi:peptidoglycan/LPS O-acetylase OafA/YrhL
MEKDGRLSELDGLRGIAILLVMGYHYFYALAGSGLYPYGDMFATVPIFKYGYLGVELFFTISGFVIAMTLETCATPWEFLTKRIARIWPPLLFCSITTFLFIRLVPTPFAATDIQQWYNFLPSLTMTPASAWQWLSPNIRLIDFSYWSLVVEARFYLFAAVLF